MDTWVKQVHRRAQIVMDQIMATKEAAADTGVDLSAIERQNWLLLERLYSEDFPAARLRDDSDIVLRAEGPGADHFAPSLRSFNWLTDHVKTQLTRLTASVLPMAVKDAHAAAKRIDWVFMGYAPGSIMLGFALRTPESMPGFEESDRIAHEMLSTSAQMIATVPQFVGDAGLRAEISEAITDPALRDSAVIAAWSLAPTQQSGIHTIQVASRNGDSGSLSQRERMVLKTAIDRPDLRQKHRGEFSGNMRAADLDKQRATLRDVADIGAIRCILPPEMEAETSLLFGKRVIVEGEYETDKDGRPRLMQVHSLKPDLSQESLL